MTYAVTVLAITLLALGIYALFSLRRDGWRRYVGPGLLGVLCLANFYAVAASLGMARPVWLGLPADHIGVLAVQYDEGRAIYLWGLPDGSHEPVAIVLPWSLPAAKEMAEQSADGSPMEIDKTSGGYKVSPKPLPQLKKD